jgi:hypothetical protein
MNQARSLKIAGIALLTVGTVLVLLGLSGGGPALRIGGPIVGFLGVVLLAQAKGRSPS